MSRIYNSKNFIIRNLPVIIAFLAPAIVLAIMFAFREIFPFGEQMYLRSDMYHQYATFLKEFQSILKNGDSLLYTWNIGLGSDLPGTYAYYLATPAYWLVGLFSDKNIPEFMASLIIIKAGLMSATFTIYMQSRLNRRSFIFSAFGIFYAMSSYMAAFSWNLMWLDDLLLLPLIVLGLERLVKEKKVVMYTISLFIAILSNYYIAIMICIFLVLYFIYLVICESEKMTFRKFLGSTGRFALFSVLAGLMASATVIPALVNLSATASGNFSFPKTLRVYFNLLEMISHGTMNVEPTVLSGYIPNIYCTIALFMLVPLYLLSKKIAAREKIGKVVLLAIFLISFSMNIPTYIWHGFHFPNSLSSRQSFIYIFLVLVIACEVMVDAENYRFVELASCFAAGEIAVFALQVLFDSKEYTLIMTAISGLFLALYFIWICLKKSGRVAEIILIIGLFAVVISEAAINTDATGYSTTSRTNYMKDNESILTLLDEVDDGSFYRVEKVRRRTKNDGAWLNYRSASEFSSTTLKGISDFYDQFGMQSSTNSFSYYGHTPLITAILDVRYELSPEEIEDQLMTLKGQTEDMYIYENRYVLPLGYMARNNVLRNVNTTLANPFSVQNSFAQAAARVNNLFSSNSTDSGEEVRIDIAENGRGFIYINDKLESAQVTIKRGMTEVLDKEFTGLENQQIVDIGDVEKGDRVTVVSTDDDQKSIKVLSAVMSYDKLERFYNNLSENVWEIDSFSDTYVSGTIHAGDSEVMMTSIPYYKGWDVYVDGLPTEYTSFDGAFIVVELLPGDHRIEFRYHSPYLGSAIALSIVSIALFAGICAYRKGRRKA